MNNPVGLCTWSLKNNPFDVVEVLKASGLKLLHLELVALEIFRIPIQEHEIGISCTMLAFPQEDYSSLDQIRETGGIVPDDCWALNRKLVVDAIERTAELGVAYLSFHAGFMDHTNAESYREFCSRMVELADVAARFGIMVLLETGQERASDLRVFLEEMNHPFLGVNFDTANMILYGKGDPIEALQVLAPWIKHVHIKDATPAAEPGEWGEEVPWGEGEVDPVEFIQTLEALGYTGALAIEREAGRQRREDIMCAAKRLKEMK